MLLLNSWIHAELALCFTIHFIHVFSQLEIKWRHLIVLKVRGKFYLEAFSSIEWLPLGMVIIELAELSNFLNEVVSLFKTIEMERVTEMIEIVCQDPSLDCTTIIDIVNDVIVHICKIFHTFLVVGVILALKVIKVSLGKWKTVIHFSWRMLCTRNNLQTSLHRERSNKCFIQEKWFGKSLTRSWQHFY